MKPFLLVIICLLPFVVFSQATLDGRWTVECGASTNNAFRRSAGFNFRYISPKFRWSDENLTEEQEKHPEKFNRTRIMFELIYAHPFKVLCIGSNVQYRLLKYKRLSLEAYGGLKLFFIRGTDFPMRREYVKGAGKGVWYLNAGLLCQLDLGVILPFADIGYDGIITIGSEFNLHAIYRKPKNRYKLHPRKT